MKRLWILTVGAWAIALGFALVPRAVSTQGLTEAPAGFSGLTNGVLDQAAFDAARDVFAEQESIEQGLGPVYNAQSCGECHQNPVSGGVSQIAEFRAGRLNARGRFVDHPGGSLIHSRAIDAAAQEHLLPGNDVLTLRTSLNTLGDGFVEAIDDTTLESIAAYQAAFTRGQIAGQVIHVPVNEAGDVHRVGRFGWKNQHASLVSFAADAYLNEMGITSPLQPVENTTNGRSVAPYDHVADPENVDDVLTFAQFMRSTRAPSRDADLAATPEAQRGEQLFDDIGCSICHVSSITTAPAGTLLNGGTFVVPDALGSKIIHPFGDFLLHDVGTGDGIVQNGGQATANKMRTAPLWGLRTHDRFMHDGLSPSLEDAILRHRGEALKARIRFRALSRRDQAAMLTFLLSL